MDILIVEDNEELGQLIFDFLRNSGYSADWVKSAENALENISKENYKLLLLDVMLPGQDGFAALSKIRKEHNMPVLMMSAPRIIPFGDLPIGQTGRSWPLASSQTS